MVQEEPSGSIEFQRLLLDCFLICQRIRRIDDEWSTSPPSMADVHGNPYRSMAGFYQCRSIPGSLHLLPSRGLVQQPVRSEKDHGCGLFLAIAGRWSTDRSSEPGYVCARQIVHRRHLSFFLGIGTHFDHRDRLPSPSKHRHSPLQLWLVCR